MRRIQAPLHIFNVRIIHQLKRLPVSKSPVRLGLDDPVGKVAQLFIERRLQLLVQHISPRALLQGIQVLQVTRPQCRRLEAVRRVVHLPEQPLQFLAQLREPQQLVSQVLRQRLIARCHVQHLLIPKPIALEQLQGYPPGIGKAFKVPVNHPGHHSGSLLRLRVQLARQAHHAHLKLHHRRSAHRSRHNGRQRVCHRLGILTHERSHHGLYGVPRVFALADQPDQPLISPAHLVIYIRRCCV